MKSGVGESQIIPSHQAYHYYLKLLNDKFTSNIDLINGLLPFFKDQIDEKLLIALSKLISNRFVKLVITIYQLLRHCECCNRFEYDQIGMLTQIMRLMLLNLFVIQDRKQEHVSFPWNHELIVSRDLNSFITRNYYYHSLYRYNNDILTEKLTRQSD